MPEQDQQDQGKCQTHMGQGVGNQEQAEEYAQGDKNPPFLQCFLWLSVKEQFQKKYLKSALVLSR